MAKTTHIKVKEVSVKTLNVNGSDYMSITDIAKQKNLNEPKDVVKNWIRLKNTLEYLDLWEQLNNSLFKGVEFDPLLRAAGSNAFTMSPSRWVELTGAIGIFTKNGSGGGTYAQKDIAFKFASWVSVEFELYLVKESNPEKNVAEFIHFLPVLAYDGSSMKQVDASRGFRYCNEWYYFYFISKTMGKCLISKC